MTDPPERPVTTGTRPWNQRGKRKRRTACRRSGRWNFATAAGVVFQCSSDDSRWQLTECGLDSVVPVKLLWLPRLVFAPREGIALRDKASYELVLQLRADGWAWAEWKAKSKLRKKDPRCLSDMVSALQTFGTAQAPLQLDHIFYAYVLHRHSFCLIHIATEFATSASTHQEPP